MRCSAATLAPTDAERSALSVRRDSPDRLVEGLWIDVQAVVGRAVSDAASLDEVKTSRVMDVACDVLVLDEWQVGELDGPALFHGSDRRRPRLLSPYVQRRVAPAPVERGDLVAFIEHVDRVERVVVGAALHNRRRDNPGAATAAQCATGRLTADRSRCQVSTAGT